MKRLFYISTVIITVLLLFNLYQYNRNADFEKQLGFDYQRTVRDSMYVLEEGNPKQMIKTLQGEDGQFRLERHIGELTLLSRKFHMMNGKISMIGVVLDSIVNDFHELAKNFNNEMDYHYYEKAITSKTQFLITLLNEMDSISGENERRYYREFTNSESKTSNLVWIEYKKFEKK